MLGKVGSNLRSRRSTSHNDDNSNINTSRNPPASNDTSTQVTAASSASWGPDTADSTRVKALKSNKPKNLASPSSTGHSSSNVSTTSKTKLDVKTPIQSRQSSAAPSLSNQSSSINNSNTTTPPSSSTETLFLSTEQVSRDESRRQKIWQRIVLGSVMFATFCGILYAGHLYICLLVALIETVLFYELVRVRYSHYFHTNIQGTIPLFRTTQWCWFMVAIFYTYGDFASDVVQNNSTLHYLLPYVKYTGSVSFILYSTTLMVTIVSLQREHLKFQINQASWTVVVLCLTLGQLKYVMHNIFNGLIWFVLPVCLVIINDIMAYVCGMSMGRKFISRPFLPFSPNKTWEGFLGAGFFTMIISWYLSKFLAGWTWMTCPTNEFRLVPESLECTLDPVFVRAQWVFPSQIFELFPRSLVRTLPNVVQICSTLLLSDDLPLSKQMTSSDGDPFVLNIDDETNLDMSTAPVPVSMYELSPCVSGNANQVHHHFELRIKDDFYPIQVHALWLALFASVVAPFGGFLASAIKRAYGLKDFAALIPGHGGVMDRMDCQFLMALCTWVYYNTFIKIATVSVSKLSYLFSLLTAAEQEEFRQWILLNQSDYP